jgi:PAS domain S-box-containing protein
MKDLDKSKEELLKELKETRKKLHDLEERNNKYATSGSKQVETESRKKGSLLNIIGSTARVGGWELDPQTLSQKWTDEVYRIHEIDKTFYPNVSDGINFYAPKSRPIIENAVRRAIEFGESFDLELEFITGKGNHLWVHSIGVPEYSNGKITKILGSIQDITYYKKSAEELRDSLMLNALFMKYSPIYAYIKSVTSSESKVLMASENYIDMIGIPGSEMVGKNMFELFPSEFAEKITADDWMVVSSQQVLDLEEELSGRSYRTIKFPILLGDKTMLAGYTIDITQRKRAEAELIIKNEELKIINAQKDKLFSIVSHDLRNPFTSILGFSQVLLDKVKGKEYEEIEKYADIINDSSLRAMGLLNNLIEWSRLQTGRLEFDSKRFKMISLINDTLLLFRHITNQKSIQITSTFTSELTVCADKDMISTILRNLISNAVKFTLPGGSISISAEKNNSRLLVSIADTGIGIPKEKLNAIFQGATKISTPGTQNESGSGFGLLLCKEFVVKHGGELIIESIEGKGSTFSFTIPAK